MSSKLAKHLLLSATNYYNNNKDIEARNYRTYRYKLPIETMFDMKITAKLLIYTTDIFLSINCSNNELFYTRLIESYNSLTLHDFISALRNLKNILSNLAFDKITGKCILSKTDAYPLDEWDELLSRDYIILSDITCCVCLENTLTKTRCKHNLCIPCLDKIIKDDANYKRCPICRKKIDCVINYNITNDDNESDNESDNSDETNR